jgi:hypothetical protein
MKAKSLVRKTKRFSGHIAKTLVGHSLHHKETRKKVATHLRDFKDHYKKHK